MATAAAPPDSSAMHRLRPASLITAISVCCCALLLVAVTAQPEPYPYLHHCNATALPSRPLSPDPLVRYRWDGDEYDGEYGGDADGGFDPKKLQIYASPPESWAWVASVKPAPCSIDSSSSGGGRYATDLGR